MLPLSLLSVWALAGWLFRFGRCHGRFTAISVAPPAWCVPLRERRRRRQLGDLPYSIKMPGMQNGLCRACAFNTVALSVTSSADDRCCMRMRRILRRGTSGPTHARASVLTNHACCVLSALFHTTRGIKTENDTGRTAMPPIPSCSRACIG